MWQNLPDEELVRRTFNYSQGARGESAQDLSPELTRRLLDTNRILNKSINALNKSTVSYSRILIGLTAILAILAGLQIYLILR